MALRQKDAFVPLLQVLYVLVENGVEGLLLIDVDFEVDVSVAVLGLAEGHLVVEFRITKGLPMGLHDCRDELLGHFGGDHFGLLFLSLPLFLCFPFEAVCGLEGLPILGCHVL